MDALDKRIYQWADMESTAWATLKMLLPFNYGIVNPTVRPTADMIELKEYILGCQEIVEVAIATYDEILTRRFHSN